MPQAVSSDTDDDPHDPCPVLTLATVRPDAHTTTWCKLLPEMEGCLSQPDRRRLRTTRSSLKAFVFLRNRRGTYLLRFRSSVNLMSSQRKRIFRTRGQQQSPLTSRQHFSLQRQHQQQQRPILLSRTLLGSHHPMGSRSTTCRVGRPKNGPRSGLHHSGSPDVQTNSVVSLTTPHNNMPRFPVSFRPRSRSQATSMFCGLARWTIWTVFSVSGASLFSGFRKHHHSFQWRIHASAFLNRWRSGTLWLQGGQTPIISSAVRVHMELLDQAPQVPQENRNALLQDNVGCGSYSCSAWLSPLF